MQTLYQQKDISKKAALMRHQRRDSLSENPMPDSVDLMLERNGDLKKNINYLEQIRREIVTITNKSSNDSAFEADRTKRETEFSNKMWKDHGIIPEQISGILNVHAQNEVHKSLTKSYLDYNNQEVSVENKEDSMNSQGNSLNEMYFSIDADPPSITSDDESTDYYGQLLQTFTADTTNTTINTRLRRSSSSFETSYAGKSVSQLVGRQQEVTSLLSMTLYGLQQPYPCYDRDRWVNLNW